MFQAPLGMQIQLLSLHHPRNNYSKSLKPPVKSDILHTMGEVLLCPRKFICAVSPTGHRPSQVFSVNTTVALAVPLRSDSHYTRHCTNTAGDRTMSYQKSPSGRSCKAGHVTSFINFFFLKNPNLREANSSLNMSRNTSGDTSPIPTSCFTIQLMRFNRLYNGFRQFIHCSHSWMKAAEYSFEWQANPKFIPT